MAGGLHNRATLASLCASQRREPAGGSRRCRNVLLAVLLPWRRCGPKVSYKKGSRTFKKTTRTTCLEFNSKFLEEFKDQILKAGVPNEWRLHRICAMPPARPPWPGSYLGPGGRCGPCTVCSTQGLRRSSLARKDQRNTSLLCVKRLNKVHL